VSPFGGLRGNVHGSSMVVGKRVVDFLLVIIELFSPALAAEALWADIGKNCAVWKGVDHERNFQRNGCRSSTTVGVRKLESLGYHVALFAWSYVQPFWHNTGVWQTDTQTTTANTRALARAARLKTAECVSFWGSTLNSVTADLNKVHTVCFYW